MKKLNLAIAASLFGYFAPGYSGAPKRMSLRSITQTQVLPRSPNQESTNKYTPHQGLRERARRVRQMCGEKLESKPRRLWIMSNIDYHTHGFAKHYLWMSTCSQRKPLAKSKLARKYPITLAEGRV